MPVAGVCSGSDALLFPSSRQKACSKPQPRHGGSAPALAPLHVVTGCLMSGHGVLDRMAHYALDSGCTHVPSCSPTTHLARPACPGHPTPCANISSQVCFQGQARSRSGIAWRPGTGLALSARALPFVTSLGPSHQRGSGHALERDEEDWCTMRPRHYTGNTAASHLPPDSE